MSLARPVSDAVRDRLGVAHSSGDGACVTATGQDYVVADRCRRGEGDQGEGGDGDRLEIHDDFG